MTFKRDDYPIQYGFVWLTQLEVTVFFVLKTGAQLPFVPLVICTLEYDVFTGRFSFGESLRLSICMSMARFVAGSTHNRTNGRPNESPDTLRSTRQSNGIINQSIGSASDHRRAGGGGGGSSSRATPGGSSSASSGNTNTAGVPASTTSSSGAQDQPSQGVREARAAVHTAKLALERARSAAASARAAADALVGGSGGSGSSAAAAAAHAAHVDLESIAFGAAFGGGGRASSSGTGGAASDSRDATTPASLERELTLLRHARAARAAQSAFGGGGAAGLAGSGWTPELLEAAGLSLPPPRGSGAGGLPPGHRMGGGARAGTILRMVS